MGGEESIVGVEIMEFDFTAFTLSPTIEAFNHCKKKDFILIAEFFDISVKKDVTKQVLKDDLFEKLVNVGILPRESEESAEVQSEALFEAEDVNPNSESVISQDPKIVLKLKELDLLLKKQECEAEKIKLRVVERQADREIQLCKLDSEAQRLAVKPVPIPRT